MTGRELFEIWAPADAVWSPWAKPVLFAELDNAVLAGAPPEPPAELKPEALSSLSRLADRATAIVVDLPGTESVLTGLALARSGYRPVPLFNNAFHPGAVINVAPILRLLAEGAGRLQGLAPDAPPAFLLDAGRMTTHGPTGPIGPGCFDNRWMVFPQDLPSASFLLSRGLSRAVVLQRQTGQPAEDLAHALLRWQESGIEIFTLDPATGGSPQPLRIEKPSRFRALWHRALATAGLRRNSAGGFGMIIPIPSQGGGGGFA